MTLTCTCPGCGCANEAEWSRAGQAIACRGCGRTMIVPAPMEAAGGADAPPAAVTFRCPACNRKFATKAELAGKKIRCTGCGAGVRVPAVDSGAAVPADATARAPVMVKFRCPTCKQVSEAPADRAGETVPCGGCGTALRVPPGPVAAAARPSSRPALMTFGGTDGVAAPAAAARRPGTDDGAGGLSQPLEGLASIEGVEAPRRAGSVLLSRSATMEQVRQEAAVAAEEKAAKAKKKKKKKRKKAGDADAKDTLILVAGVGAVVAVLALVAWRLPDLRFPLGGVLCVVGFIVYLLGLAALRQLAAEEGAFQALLFRFFPPYQLWFVARNWTDTRDYVAFFGAGLMILSLGGAVIKTSSVGKEAAAADRAYQKATRGTQSQVPPAPTGAVLGDDEE